VVRAFPLRNEGSLVHLNNVSGGVLAGDRLELNIEIEQNAVAQITTTGATRLYRHRAGRNDSEQRTRVLVRDGGLLEYLPDAVIPYAGSRHVLHTEIRLGRSSTMFWWEILAPGRLAAGERFAFERLHVQTEVHCEARPILKEDYLLEPARRDLLAAVRMLHYSHLASFCVVGEGRSAAYWRSLENCLNRVARESTCLGQAVWAATALASDGILVRGFCTSARFVLPPLIQFWRTARVAITGLDVEVPRKTY
jgi:urease accessory protein